jgi:asparagine synthetase B (glutamine-hydrolysing)
LVIADGIEFGGLSPLEVASHILVGPDGVTRQAPSSTHPSALAALEDVLRRALARPPCLIAFSGGRDSSALLAVAMRVARADSLPLPVPMTVRFPHAAAAEEADWQALAVRHTGAGDWIEREGGDDLDLIGPVSAGIMRAHGLPYPYNLHLLAPLMEEARGGTLVTGLGGDQALLPAGKALDALGRRRRPEARDALRAAAGMAPRPLRRSLLRRREAPMNFPWLTASANSELAHQWLDDQARQPFWWDRVLLNFWCSRFMQTTLRRIEALADAIGTRVSHPLADSAFVAALARDGGRTGFSGRTEAMQALFGDDLPPELIGRQSKASFNDALWSTHTRAFVDGLDDARLRVALDRLSLTDVVDVDAVRAHWSGADPLANSFLLLQACWLALEGPQASSHPRR